MKTKKKKKFCCAMCDALSSLVKPKKVTAIVDYGLAFLPVCAKCYKVAAKNNAFQNTKAIMAKDKKNLKKNGGVKRLYEK